MTHYESVEDELKREHAECLADISLRDRAVVALPKIMEALKSHGWAADLCAIEASAGLSLSRRSGTWTSSGGQEVYEREMAAQSSLRTLKCLIDGSKPGGMNGYLSKVEIERVLSFYP